ncbi:MAG: M18 family aminopeptidase, partial [Clostridiales bacterium]|nr:M18 family aminopeptidase [Clostridiales bacterium]
MSTNLPRLDAAQRLLTWIGDSPTPFHTVLTAQNALDAAGFTPLRFSDRWQLDYGKGYYVPVHDSTLIAFTVGSAMADSGNLRLALAHTDYPCFRVKPSPELYSNGCGKLNVEGYGGMLRYSWLDRPLSIAGKVALRGADPFHPRRVFVDFGRPVATIPSLAIHLNRGANDNLNLSLQKDMLPVVDVLEQAMGGEAFFRQALARECGTDPSDILDYELYVYQYEQGCLVGLEETMLSSPRLDNQTSAEACIYGLTHARREKGINLAVLFDHEEVGSRTRQGAAGSALPNAIERIYAA